MGAFIFLCDLTTERECLDRLLVGTNPGEMHQFHYSKVAVGDMIFLYNFDLGLLRGPFTALTRCLQNIEPQAWRKTRRSFLWQVRVNASTAFPIPLKADEFKGYLPLSSTRMGLLPPAELSEDQVEKVLIGFRKAADCSKG